MPNALQDEFNRQARFEFDRLREFLVLHSQATERRDTPFWRHCLQLPTTPRLQEKLDVFRANAQVFRVHEQLLTEGSGLPVMLPVRYHSLADALSSAQLDEFLGSVCALVTRIAGAFPDHAQFIAMNCGSSCAATS